MGIIHLLKIQSRLASFTFLPTDKSFTLTQRMIPEDLQYKYFGSIPLRLRLKYLTLRDNDFDVSANIGNGNVLQIVVVYSPHGVYSLSVDAPINMASLSLKSP